MFKNAFSSIKNNLGTISFCLAIFYSSFLTFSLFSYQDEILPDLLASEFLFGDEDVDPSPARYLELFGLQHTLTRNFCNTWPSVSTDAFIRFASLNRKQPSLLNSHWLSHSKDFHILYSTFRI
jgi:hypothetical protein